MQSPSRSAFSHVTLSPCPRFPAVRRVATDNIACHRRPRPTGVYWSPPSEITFPESQRTPRYRNLLQQLQAARDEYDEVATYFVFRLKYLKQGQFRGLLTQAARHHAAQLNFFRKGLKSLEAIEPHVRQITEQQHIDYQFSGLEDDDGEIAYDPNEDGELSFDYRVNEMAVDVTSASRNSMEVNEVNLSFPPTSKMENTEVNLEKIRGDIQVSSREHRIGSHSEFEDISLESSPLLASVDIRMIPVDGTTMPLPLKEGNPSNLIRVFSCLHGVKKLTLSSYFIKFLGNGIDNVPERFPTPLFNLSFLDLKEIRLNSFKDIAAFFSILRSSPNLEELVISCGHSNKFSRPVVDFLKEQCLHDFFFSQLKVVRIRGLCGTRPEWELLKLILAHSPVLETLTIVRYGMEKISESLLLQFERASENLKIMSLTL